MTYLYEFDEQGYEEQVEEAVAAAENLAELSGYSKQEIKKAGKTASSKHLLSFLERIKQYLKEMNNQGIARLLLLLTEQGIEMEDEEQFQTWLNFLEHLATQRLAEYFTTRNGQKLIDKPMDIRLAPSQLASNLKNYAQEDIKGLADIAAVLGFWAETCGSIKDSRFWSKLQKIIDKDIVFRQQDFAEDLKADMANVEDIQELNKIQNEKEQTREQKDDAQKQRQKEQEKERQKQLQNQKDKENRLIQERELIRKKNKELINQAFSNRKNRKTAVRVADEVAKKKGRGLTGEDIKKIKIKIIAKRNGR